MGGGHGRVPLGNSAVLPPPTPAPLLSTVQGLIWSDGSCHYSIIAIKTTPFVSKLFQM